MEEMPTLYSLHAVSKSLSGEEGSPLQSTDTVVDLRLLAAPAASKREHSLGRSNSAEALTLSSSGSSPQLALEQQPDNAATVVTLTASPDWEEISEPLDEHLSIVLRSDDTVTRSVVKVKQITLEEDARHINLCTEESRQSLPLSDAARSSPAEAVPSAVLKDNGKQELVADLAPGTVLGHSWTTPPLHVAPTSPSSAGRFASKVLQAVQHLLPEDLLPCGAAGSSNWLSFDAPASTSAGVRLQGGAGLQAVRNPPTGLRSVILVLPMGSRSQAAVGEASERKKEHRHWVAEPTGGERGWKLSISGSQADAEGESDRDTVVVGLGSTRSPVREVVQEPGQLVAIQGGRHCSWAGSSISLCWNVAAGVDWPSQARQEAAEQSKALRQAAIAAKNPWLAEEAGEIQPLHWPRLLFFAACSIHRVHGDIVQGLRRHFLPVCKEELKQQADPSLPQMNAARGILESTEPSCLRCSCCGGGFVFSYVRLIERREERQGNICWSCWEQRRDIGLSGPDGKVNNARKCTVIPAADVARLIALIERGTTGKRPGHP